MGTWSGELPDFLPHSGLLQQGLSFAPHFLLSSQLILSIFLSQCSDPLFSLISFSSDLRSLLSCSLSSFVLCLVPSRSSCRSRFHSLRNRCAIARQCRRYMTCGGKTVVPSLVRARGTYPRLQVFHGRCTSASRRHGILLLSLPL